MFRIIKFGRQSIRKFSIYSGITKLEEYPETHIKYNPETATRIVSLRIKDADSIELVGFRR